jgi:hypothetical protein
MTTALHDNVGTTRTVTGCFVSCRMQMATSPRAAAAAAAGDPGPSTSAAPAAQGAVQQLQQARDALVSHLVALHAAATAQADATLELDGDGAAAAAGQAPLGPGGVAVIQDAAFRVLSDVALVFGSKSWKVRRRPGGTLFGPFCGRCRSLRYPGFRPVEPWTRRLTLRLEILR